MNDQGKLFVWRGDAGDFGHAQFSQLLPLLPVSKGCRCVFCRAYWSRGGPQITSGQCHIARYEAEAPHVHRRAFCEHCGSSLGDLATDSGIYVVAASILDDDPDLKPMGHIHTASKPGWYEIADGLPQFEGDYVPPD